MMTLPEFCEEFRISHAKARRMKARGVLLIDESADPRAARIRETFLSRNPLSALDLCDLVEEPGLLLQLGRYADKANEVLETIGDAVEDAAPREVALSIMDAANGDAEALAELVAWIKSALPADGSPVGFHWLAVRLLLPIAPNLRKFEAEKIRRALVRSRKSPDFAGWWRYEGRAKRKVTIYARPMLDL